MDSSQDIRVPADFHQMVSVCTTAEEVLKSRTFLYLFIQTLKCVGISDNQIREYVTTIEALIHNTPIDPEKLLSLREICKKPDMSKHAQTLFGQLEFTGVNSAARKNLREFLAIEEGHRDQTSKKIISQILVMIYNTLPREVLKTIADSEVEKEIRHSYQPHDIIDSFLRRKYDLEKGSRITFEYPRDCFLGYGRTPQGDVLGFDEMGATRLGNIFFLGEDTDPEFLERNFSQRISEVLHNRFCFSD